MTKLIKPIMLFLVLESADFRTCSAQWTPAGLDGSTPFSITSLGTNLFAATSKGLYYSSHPDTNWQPLAPLAWLSLSTYCDDSNLYVGGWAGQILFSSDSGRNWSSKFLGVRSSDRFGPFVIAIFKSGQYLFAGTDGDGLFHSVDNGANWSESNTRLYSVKCFALSGPNLFVGTNTGIYRTTNNGSFWRSINSGLMDSAAAPPTVNAIAFADTILFVGTSKGVFLSINQGDSWIQSSLKDVAVVAMAVHLDSTSTTLFAGTNSGVYTSKDHGSNWIDISNSAVKNDCRSLYLLGTTLLAGTYYKGVWRYPVSGVTSVELPVTSPHGITLFQNYPNPFNSTTVISFSLPQSSMVSITIVDALGREVALLANQQLSSGHHAYRWNAALQSSGVYFSRLRVNTTIQTRRLLLLR